LATLMCQRSTYAMIWQETVAKAVAIKTKALALATRGLAGAQAVFTALTSRATYAMIAQKAVSLAMAAGTTLMTVAQWGLNVAMTANPVGLIVVGVAALCAGLYALYKYCEPVRTAMTGLWDGIKTAMEPVAEKIGWVFEKLDFIRSMGGKAGMKLRAYLGLDEENAKADTPAPETIKTSMESGPAAKEAMASPETQAYITPESDPTHPANTTDPDVSEADMQQMLEDALKGTTGQYQVNIPAETQSSPAGAAMKPMPSVPAAMDRPRRQQSPPAHLPHAGSEGVPGMSDADMQQMLEDTRRSAPAQGRRVDTDRLIASVKTPAAGPASTASRQSAAIHPSLNLTVQLHGVSDRDFGDRVLGAVVDKKSEFERFLGGLMKNASRVAYE
ncbi:hypothetical protein LJC47_07810, partial [Desulfosarcina sp. OttesenSCG-928-B08]|nr:hypothetical protein [Desulfosarcina sp. OttesenSCG-928-B08]